MYSSTMNGSSTNRLPKTAEPSKLGNAGKQVGNAFLQAAVLVVAVKVVDLAVEMLMAKFRKPRPPEAGQPA